MKNLKTTTKKHWMGGRVEVKAVLRIATASHDHDPYKLSAVLMLKYKDDLNCINIQID